MKATDYIANKIDGLTWRYVVTCDDFVNDVNGKEAISKALHRMATTTIRNLPMRLNATQDFRYRNFDLSSFSKVGMRSPC